MKSLHLIVLAVLSLFLFSEVPAHAYVDGGTGSYILQISIAALWGIGFAFRTSIQKVIAKLHRNDKDKPGSSSDD